jgi:tRNA1Val (adenine37-N6)-methyltransferase
MKVGTDAVLLGAWVKVDGATSILEIGTGNGTIALMLAQRTPENACIDAIEIESSDAMQAQQNFVQSPWSEKIHTHHTSIQEFDNGNQYDLIVTNPPYFINSQSPPDEKRHQARHTITLTQAELILSTIRLLKDSGRLNVILPYAEGLQFLDRAKEAGFCCTRQFSFRTRQEKPVERWLMEFSKLRDAVETGEILLYKNQEEWSDCYKVLTQDFYLKL